MNYYELAKTNADVLQHHLATMRRFALNFDGWRDTCVITTKLVLPAFNALSLKGSPVQPIETPLCILFLPYNAATRLVAEISDAVVLSLDTYMRLIDRQQPIGYHDGYNLWLRYVPQSTAEGMGWQAAKERVKREQSTTTS